MKKNFLSLILAIVMALSVCLSVYADETTISATRGELVTALMIAADDYQPEINKETLIRGYDNGQLRENQPAKKIEALVMLSRAFGELPKPVGNDLRSGVFNVAFTDVPDWAKNEIDNLTNAGLLVGKQDGTLGVNDSITLDEFQNLISRVWSLKGSHLKDDFYEAINKEWLNKSTIPPGSAMSAGFTELQIQNNDKIKLIIEELAGKSFVKGTKEQRIADFYSTALDSLNRNKQGIKPIQSYINAFDEAKTLDELVKADLNMEKEIGLFTLFGFGITNDAKNSSHNALYYSGMSIGLDKNSLVTENPVAKKAYIEYVTKLLVASGEQKGAAGVLAASIYDMEKSLASVSLNPYEASDINKIYNPYTIEQFDELFEKVDMKDVLKSLRVEHADKVIVMDVNLAKKGAELLTDSNLDVLKAYAKLRLLISTGSYLSDEFRDASYTLAAALYGVAGEQTNKDVALGMTQDFMSGYLEQTFAEKYFSPEAKKDVELMVKNITTEFKDRIKALDWMSDATKAKAIDKLDKIIVKIGYPDKWDTTLDEVEIKTYDEGGSLFSNYVAVRAAFFEDMKAGLGKPVDRAKWVTSVFTVNAFYNMLNNDITFPAGILQAPFYDFNAKPEVNYGAIGVIIGHEITHAFDNNGAAFDENGNANNWWTEDDYNKFMAKNEAVYEFYNGIEVIPGIVNDGLLTLSENIADLGGLAATLQVVSKRDNPDYKAYFESNAIMWKSSTTREFNAYLSSNDTHSANKIRVNRALVNFQPFYDVFDIKEGDGMYVAPEERVSVW